jgi:hypothetical protein
MIKKKLVIGFAISLMASNSIFAQGKCIKTFTCPKVEFNRAGYINWKDVIVDIRTKAISFDTQIDCQTSISIDFKGCGKNLANLSPEDKACYINTVGVLLSETNANPALNGASWDSNSSPIFYNNSTLNIGGIDPKKCKTEGAKVICNTCLEVNEDSHQLEARVADPENGEKTSIEFLDDGK